jgi:hypothetical protein
MHVAKERSDWWHTSYLMAHIANVHRDARKHPTPYQPRAFHPYEIQQGTNSQKLHRQASMDLLKRTFIDGQKKISR